MSSGWSQEFRRFALILSVCLVVGLAIDQVALCLLAGLAGHSGWQLYLLRKMQRWAERPEADTLPTEDGVWGDIGAQLVRHQTRHRGRERRLLEQLQEFQVAAAALPDAVVNLGRNWEIRWINAAAVRLLGLHDPADLGQPLINLFRSPELARYLAGGLYEQALELSAPGRQQRMLSVRVIPYAEQQWLLLAQDATDRYRLERVRKDFVANVSHELRTPLTVISGFVENLQHDETGCGQRWARPLKLMAQQSQRMQRIVEDLLLLAKLEAGRVTLEQSHPVDVAVMCAELRDIALSARPEVPAVRVDIDTDVALLGDEQQLRSAFLNLVMNAVNYTPPEGEVQIRWYRGEAGSVCFEVADTGEGIAPEHIPRLTERFYRVDTGRSRQRGGTGLGLAIVKHVLHHHGAVLHIESQPGAGSRFMCRFPRSRVIEPDGVRMAAERV